MKKLLIGGVALLVVGIVMVIILRETPAKSPTLTLTNGSWKWNSATNNGSDVKPNKPDSFVLVFGNDDNFSSTTDCNQIGGSYSINGQNIRIEQMMSTKMYCENSQESMYAGMLNDADAYEVNGNELILKLKDNKGSMQFSYLAGEY